MKNNILIWYIPASISAMTIGVVIARDGILNNWLLVVGMSVIMGFSLFSLHREHLNTVNSAINLIISAIAQERLNLFTNKYDNDLPEEFVDTIDIEGDKVKSLSEEGVEALEEWATKCYPTDKDLAGLINELLHAKQILLYGEHKVKINLGRG